jgi:hypothetical protein
MKDRHSDNDTWQTLSLATGRLLGKIDEKQNEDGERESTPGSADEQKRREQAEYVEQRLRDIERFERMVSGYYRSRRKRN